MKRFLLSSMGIAALCIASHAATFMEVKTIDQTIVKFDVKNVDEVDFTHAAISHPYVDLGLPSGTLWATYNVGANKPSESGHYFAWGETTPKKVYDWNTYKYVIAQYDEDYKTYEWKSITKYDMCGHGGILDSLSVLLPEDDAATVNWGKEWRMPTAEEQKELIEECYWVWTYDYNGSDVCGHIVYKAKGVDDKGKLDYPGGAYHSENEYSISSDTHIFLPTVSCRSSEEAGDDNEIGYYWSSSLHNDYENYGYYCIFFKNYVSLPRGFGRYYGLPVRAVRSSMDVEDLDMPSNIPTYLEIKTKDGNNSIFNIDYVNEVVYTSPDTNHPYVDLDLPSGILWATCNVGASQPEEYGNYFAWGETKPKEAYEWNNYKHADSRGIYLNSIVKYNTSGLYGKIDNLSVLLPNDDAATANWGTDWRMPTINEFYELYENTYMVWTEGYNGTDVKGVIFYKAKSAGDKNKFVSKGQTPSSDYNDSDTHVFFPTARFYGNYWSSSLDKGNEVNARHMYLCEDFVYQQEEYIFWNYYGSRKDGEPVRAVRAKK